MSLTIEDASKLGGSDISGLLGLSPWQTPLTIYARVVSALDGRPLPDQDDGHKRRGRHLEAAVLRLYAEETGAELLDGRKLIHPGMPYTRASLDSRAHRDGQRVVEAKTAGMTALRHWGEAGTDEVPQAYIPQCTWYGGVAVRCGAVDTPDVDVAALVCGDLRLYVVKFDPELFAMLEAAMERFWKDHVLPRRPPPVTDTLRDVDAAGALYPRHSGEQKHWEELSTEEQRAVRDYLKARARLKRAELRAAGAEAVLKLALKEVGKVYGLPVSTGAKSLTWKQSKQGQVTDWEAVARGLMRGMSDAEARMWIQQHTTTKEGARPLRIWATKEEEEE